MGNMGRYGSITTGPVVYTNDTSWFKRIEGLPHNDHHTEWLRSSFDETTVRDNAGKEGIEGIWHNPKGPSSRPFRGTQGAPQRDSYATNEEG